MKANQHIAFFVGILCAAAQSASTCPMPLHRFRKASMSLEYRYEGPHLVGKIFAPTKGWLALGFNQHEGLLGSTFLIARFHKGETKAEIHRVVAEGKHRPIDEKIEVLKLSQTSQGTTLWFRWYHFNMPQAQNAFLAWSRSIDFDHHSAQREHFKLKMTQ